MFKNSKAFSGFSVDDLQAAKKFYGQTLGLDVTEENMGLTIKLANGGQLFAYPKDNHQPASYTMLNFLVDDIDKTVDELTIKGVAMEHYEGFGQDGKGIARGDSEKMPGPEAIAWFKDPAGNILAVIEE